MTLDKNYSTINKQTRVISVDANSLTSPRTLVKLSPFEYASGITAGDVIHFDTVAGQFVRSIANSSDSAEVFGIVETIDSDFNLNVVTNGSIRISTSRLVNLSGTNSGGNDIYFLSGTSAGFLQNCGPTFSEMIIKPVYQIAPHGDYTGIVRNYIGYLNGLSVAGQNPANPLNLKLMSISDDFSKGLFFDATTSSIHIRSLSISGTTVLTANISSKEINSIVIDPGLDVVDFNSTSNYDAKISNDGNTLLLFAKHTNKIYCIFVSGTTYTLKAIINVDLPGTPEDKLWAADDELTSMVVSTKGLQRAPSSNDASHLSPGVSSKIKYYKRSVNNITGFQHIWRKCHERHAICYMQDTRFSLEGSLRDSLDTTTGIFRTCDIKCVGKNYTLSTFALKDDQTTYKSREKTYTLPRYTSISFPGFVFACIELKFIIGSIKNTISLSYNDSLTRQTYPVIPRNYDLNDCFYHFNIHKKINNYYYEDYSYKTIYGFDIDSRKFGSGGTSPYSLTGTNYSTTMGALVVSQIPSTFKEIICSRSYSTSNIAVCASLQNFYSTGIKNLLVCKIPFNTNDGYTALRYFEFLPGSGTVPSATGHGVIKYFTVSDIPDIASLTFFNIFGTDSLFFICTPTYTIVFTYATSAFIRFNTTEDFSKAIFFSNASGEFFVVNKRIFKFSSVLQQIIELGITL